jgi:hypothetical protein
VNRRGEAKRCRDGEVTQDTCAHNLAELLGVLEESEILVL